jgi:hypothetical protein
MALRIQKNWIKIIPANAIPVMVPIIKNVVFLTISKLGS